MEVGVEFLAVDFPAANRLLIHIMAAVAEHERILISERTKTALAVAQSRGVRRGANGVKLAERHRNAATEFAATLREPIRRAFQEGQSTLQGVAKNPMAILNYDSPCAARQCIQSGSSRY